jgi:RNA polymerase sigma-70 factor (ECF subfamily)
MSDSKRAEEFVFLLARHERMLGGYVAAMVPHAQDADDILQDTKVVMWRSFEQYQAGTNFAAWARKIAFHRVLAFRKRKHRDPLDFSDEFLRAVSEEADLGAARLEQRQRVLQYCVAKLPSDHRTLVLLRYDEQLDLEEIAVRMNRTVGALYRLLSRVRFALYDCVSKHLSADHELA